MDAVSLHLYQNLACSKQPQKTHSISLMSYSRIEVSSYLANVRSKSGSAITYPSYFQYLQGKKEV